MSYHEYLARYFIQGMPHWVWHPNARANHFFAYSIKNSVLELLEDKPAPYRKASAGRPPAAAAERRVSRPYGDLGIEHTWIGPMLRELHQRYAEPWNAESLARLARRSKSSMYAEFIAVMKVTPMEYVKRLRLDEAARLLRDTEAAVAEIATRVGFVSAQHFSREFGRRFEYSPSAYRRGNIPWNVGHVNRNQRHHEIPG